MNTNTPIQDQKQTTTGSTSQMTHDEVAQAAFSLYQKHGSRDGRDVQNWLEAEKSIRAKCGNPTQDARPATKAAIHSAR